MNRALVIASYLILLIGGYFAVGIVVENEQNRAIRIETKSCRDLRDVVVETNRRLLPHEAVRRASLHAVKTAARSARTRESAARYREAAETLRDAHFQRVDLPKCGRIDDE